MDWFKLVLSLLIGHACGMAAWFIDMNGWYGSIVKPSFNPPGWVFGPVWFVLFTLMGVSLYLVWTVGFNNSVLAAFILQWLFCTSWSFVFFGLHNISLAFVNILLLLVSIISYIILSYSVSRTASYLFIPYLLWVCFASILNFSIWRLN